jgi:hypothetical protein
MVFDFNHGRAQLGTDMIFGPFIRVDGNIWLWDELEVESQKDWANMIINSKYWPIITKTDRCSRIEQAVRDALSEKVAEEGA